MDRSEKTTCLALAGLLAAILLIANAAGAAAQGNLQEAKAKPDQAQTKAAVDGMAATRTLDLGRGVTMAFVLIRPGSFMMGSDSKVSNKDEKPVRKVTIAKPFYMAKYEVTQEQWESLMGSNPSHFKGGKNPVEKVSWNECRDFLTKLKDKASGMDVRLPTEAEWEYACRAGSSAEFCYGDAEAGLGDYAWFRSNSDGKTHPVGEKKPNAWGLHDMHGNVWEWCSDWYGRYGSAAETDPVGPSSGSGHVRRGGSWLDAAGSCRSAFRDSYVPGDRYSNRGLRVVSMNYERVTFAGELKRMRSTAHLYQPQGHKAYQYSGFSRKGGNPDRFDCLYVEDGWRVVADHKGPGVTTRIWTPHPPELVSNGRSWGDIRIEVDDKILFSGPANEFFVRGLLPFSDPLTTVRFLDPGHKTAEREQQGEKKWLTSYVPIPFKKRFRYMQRDVLYCNINIKALPQGMEVESYWEIQWNQVQKDIEKTAAVWTDMDVLAGSVARCARAARTVALPALETGGSSRVVVAEFKGPAIIHGVRFKTKEDAAWQGVTMEVTVDDQSGPIVQTPLDYGFGSRQQRTLALGQSRDGWRYCYLPMPFRRNCRVELVSRAAESAAIDAELFVEEEATLREDVLYLHSKANEGTFRSGVDRFERPDLPLSEFFYENGYRALDHKGRGHLVAYLDLFQCQPELDEHVYIDDERTFPDNIWNGTGHEDLFDQSWGHSPLSSPMASGGSQDFKEVNVKLFWNTPMTFRTAIRFNWEWAYKFGVPPPLDAHFASVVYWYE